MQSGNVPVLGTSRDGKRYIKYIYDTETGMYVDASPMPSILDNVLNTRALDRNAPICNNILELARNLNTIFTATQLYAAIETNYPEWIKSELAKRRRWTRIISWYKNLHWGWKLGVGVLLVALAVGVSIANPALGIGGALSFATIGTGAISPIATGAIIGAIVGLLGGVATGIIKSVEEGGNWAKNIIVGALLGALSGALSGALAATGFNAGAQILGNMLISTGENFLSSLIDNKTPTLAGFIDSAIVGGVAGYFGGNGAMFGTTKLLSSIFRESARNFTKIFVPIITSNLIGFVASIAQYLSRMTGLCD